MQLLLTTKVLRLHLTVDALLPRAEEAAAPALWPRGAVPRAACGRAGRQHMQISGMVHDLHGTRAQGLACPYLPLGQPAQRPLSAPLTFPSLPAALLLLVAVKQYNHIRARVGLLLMLWFPFRRGGLLLLPLLLLLCGQLGRLACAGTCCVCCWAERRLTSAVRKGGVNGLSPGLLRRWLGLLRFNRRPSRAVASPPTLNSEAFLCYCWYCCSRRRRYCSWLSTTCSSI